MSIERNYLVTLTFLIMHQIDAAYWHEWDMFFLPGGIQGFLLFNIVVFPIVLYGYRQVVLNSVNAKYYSYLCGGLGILTFFIHASFALYGAEEFSLPFSVIVIVNCLIFGLLQIKITIRAKAEGNCLSS